MIKKILLLISFLPLAMFANNEDAQVAKDKAEAGGDFAPFTFQRKSDYTKQNPELGISYRYEAGFAWVDEYHYRSGIPAAEAEKASVSECSKAGREIAAATKHGYYKSAEPVSSEGFANLGGLKFRCAAFEIVHNDGLVVRSYIYLTVLNGKFLKYRISFRDEPTKDTFKQFENFVSARAAYLKKNPRK